MMRRLISVILFNNYHLTERGGGPVRVQTAAAGRSFKLAVTHDPSGISFLVSQTKSGWKVYRGLPGKTISDDRLAEILVNLFEEVSNG
jgi:hypothetical protein